MRAEAEHRAETKCRAEDKLWDESSFEDETSIPSKTSFRSWTWICWLIAGLTAISATRNPLYLILILLILNIIFAIFNDEKNSEGLAVISPLRFSLFVIGMATIFNTLTSHFGETMLFTIPGRIPLISGPITLEAMIFGFTNGLVLSAMLTAFTIIQLVLPVSALIHLMPRTFYPLSIVISIAITFLPSTRRQIDQIIEAQKIRGHRLSGLRDWLPLVMPLLVGGLERSMQLAETMTARGFASQSGLLDHRLRLQVLVGLLFVIGGWIANLTPNFETIGLALLICGAGLIGYSFWKLGRQMPRTTFKKERWGVGDILITIASIGLILLLLFGLSPSQKESLSYQPYPTASLPLFDVWLGFMLQALLIPVLLKPRPKR